MSEQGTAAAPATPSIATTFEEAWAKLQGWASNAWSTITTDVADLAAKEVPVIEADVVSAVETFGEDLMDDAIQLLEAGLTAPSTVGTVANNLVKNAAAQGKTIAGNLANTVASQVVAAAQLEAAKLQNPTQ